MEEEFEHKLYLNVFEQLCHPVITLLRYHLFDRLEVQQVQLFKWAANAIHWKKITIEWVTQFVLSTLTLILYLLEKKYIWWIASPTV